MGSLLGRVFVIPSILLGVAIGVVIAPTVGNALDRVDQAEHWQIERQKIINSGFMSEAEFDEIESEEELYWVSEKAQNAKRANDFLRDVRLGK